MPTATKPLTLVTEPTTTALERLHRDRASLADEAKRLTGVLTRLQTEAAAGDALNAELDRLAETETNEMRAWASGGALGHAPKGKQAERQAIAVKLAATSATAAAASGAIADTAAKIAELNNQLRLIGNAIEQAIFDALEIEHGDILIAYRANCETGTKLAAKLHGLATLFGDTGRTLMSQGNQEAGMAYLSRASALTSLKLPSPGVTRHEIEAAAAEWARRATTLRAS